RGGKAVPLLVLRFTRPDVRIHRQLRGKDEEHRVEGVSLRGEFLGALDVQRRGQLRVGPDGEGCRGQGAPAHGGQGEAEEVSMGWWQIRDPSEAPHSSGDAPGDTGESVREEVDQLPAGQPRLSESEPHLLAQGTVPPRLATLKLLADELTNLVAE